MIRLLLVAPYLNRDATGEAWSTWKWVDGLSQRFETTLLTTQYPDQARAEELFPSARIKAMPSQLHSRRFARWSFTAKPDYPRFYYFATRTIASLRRSGATWDLAHHLSPLALRYPSPLATSGTPYVLGPQAGSVPNPPGFASELRRSEPFYMRLRETDQFRFKHDPLLRASLLNCRAFVAVAPYVISSLPYELPGSVSFEVETGLRGWQMDPPAGAGSNDKDARAGLRLLYVGRITRSKGCRDLVRAMPSIRERLGSVHLHVIGDGPDRRLCARERAELRVERCVSFHGHQPHATVMQHYQDAHLFVFPSFREPSGNVVLEAMSAGLPLIVANAGGPGHVVTDECGAKVDPVTPQQFAGAIADAVVSLASRPWTWPRCAEAARWRVAEIGTWQDKYERMAEIYREALDA